VKRAAIVILLLLACHREAPPPAKKIVHVTTTNMPSDERKVKENDLIRKSARFLDSAKIGTALGPDGGVAEETFTFAEHQPVYFTMNLRESPAGLQTHATWLDAKGKELVTEIHPMNGAKRVTFAMKTPLAPGVYRVEGYWGGNFAAEKTFEVVAGKKK
jgi:hypothetical protein